MFQAFDQKKTWLPVAPCAPQFRVTSGCAGNREVRFATLSDERTLAGRQVGAPGAEHELLAALVDVRLRAADRPRVPMPAGRVPLTLST